MNKAEAEAVVFLLRNAMEDGADFDQEKLDLLLRDGVYLASKTHR